MSSWFSEISSKAASKAAGLSSKAADLSSKVQAAIPVDKEMIQKLTLTTPEMNAEREQIYQDEQRKAALKDSLADMLPWETRDAEREILVDECKEAILALSDKDETFFGPYLMPALPKVNDDVESKGDSDDEEGVEEVEEEEPGPSEESLEKLAKLEPLPALLNDFDLDAHVGLIQRLLKIDDKLVEKQSRLSGAGSREHFFWKNYFFHCAFTRYEAGLSIDEIWSDEPRAPPSETVAATEEEEHHHEEEHTITFETEEQNEKDADASSAPEKAPLFDQENAASNEDKILPAGSASSGSNEGGDYEMVGPSEDDAEMDELEAEIARELED